MAILQIKNLYFLQTDKTSYIIRINENGSVQNLYWGPYIESQTDFDTEDPIGRSGFYSSLDMISEEASSFGVMRYKESSIKVRFNDNVGDFRYSSSGVVDGDTLCITLKDIHYNFQVKLFYQVLASHDIIKRWQVAENFSAEPVVLERFYSMQIGIPGDNYQILNYNGQWGAEFQPYWEPLSTGKHVYESLRGITAHTANPVFAICQNPDEQSGTVYFGALEYSGNFKVVAETTPYHTVNTLIGVSDTDFSWVLEQSEIFTTPAVYLGVSSNGLGEMSRTLHRFERDCLSPDLFRDKPLPVLYNSWEATLFSVNVENQMKLADKAKDLGVELFVMDDGWFGKRNDDFAGLGDWYVNKEKFPNGLSELISHVHSCGMQFGLWIEPEMINENSDLFRTHPEWAYQYETREILTGRHQYQLNLTLPAVHDFILQMIDDLLSQNEIAYIKWDYNRSLGETSPNRNCSIEKNKEIWVRHTESFYSIIRELRKRHPRVEFEACASGGGRVDLGTMRYFDEYWVSDNTDALDRIFIQDGYSYFYPAKYMRAWATDSPNDISARNIPLSFRLHVAMMGAFGIGCDLNEMNSVDQKLTADAVTIYKKIGGTIQFGDLYRLQHAKRDGIHAVQYCKEDESVLFVFLPQINLGRRRYCVKLKGLRPNQKYKLTLNQGEEKIYSGSYCMNHGLLLNLKGDYDSQLIILKEVPKDGVSQ